MRSFILSILISQVAFAFNFAGTWTGQGLIESSKEGNLPADSVIFEFTENGATLSSKDCWNFMFASNPWRLCGHRDLEINGADVIYRGNRIGTYSENRIEVHYMDGTTKVDAFAQITDEGTLNYSFLSVEASGQSLHETATGLKK